MNLLHLAAASGNPEMIVCLFKQFQAKLLGDLAPQVCGTARKQTFLLALIEQSSFDVIHLQPLLEHKHLHDVCAVVDASGNNVLHRCCARSRSALLATFLSTLPASVAQKLLSAQNSDLQTPIHVAAQIGCHQCLTALSSWDAGFLSSVRNGSGQTALHVALNAQCCEELVKVVALSLVDQCGARPRDQQNKFSLLHLLAAHGNATALQSLLTTEGFSPLATTEQGNTLLHIAALAG
eukprot:CAMPEP_0177637918 /NCGR_PEP_ID=MMETSP0447-20121125/5219_1 /TAXON_ID=0 /ORGANISM="Stygamoeba regulata, Strain BSH-02190019" /LENGTH=236 /DNA_ID=CAMNT_0019139861 /DNA_START=8 /DNA_END=714 /DNA_ORIENTATION=-